MQLNSWFGEESHEIKCYWPNTIILKVGGKQHMSFYGYKVFRIDAQSFLHTTWHLVIIYILGESFLKNPVCA